MNRRLVRHSLAVSLTLAFATLGCARHAEHASSATTSAKPLTKVTMNLNPTFTYASLMIAKDAGFFAAEGIDAEFVSLDPNSAVAAEAAGKLDVLSAGVRSGVFNMMARGVPMQVVADRGHTTSGRCSSEAFVAPVETAKRIAANGGSLKGERVAMIRGGIAEMLIERLLDERKTKLDDVVVVQLPQGSAAFSRNKVDAVRFIAEPDLSEAVSGGWASVIATAEEIVPSHQSTVLVFGKHLLRDDPDLGRRFMRAYLRGIRRYNEGKSDRNIAILTHYTKLPAETIRAACWTNISADGSIDPKGVQPFLDWALQRHYLDTPVPVSTWWNPTFVEAASQQLSTEVR